MQRDHWSRLFNGTRRFTMQRTLYLIATTSRSGSTHLCRMLTATRRLGEPAEYYNVRVKPLRMQLWGATSDADYFQQVVARTSTPNGVCGIKVATVAFEQLRASLGPSFDLVRPRYIWLRRRDALRQAISLYRAKTTDIWHWHAGQPRPTACPPFDAEQIEVCRREIAAANEYWRDWFVDDANLAPLELWYEDVIAAPQTAIAEICRHVGISHEHLPAPRSELCVQRDETTEDWHARLTAAPGS
jgi:LPS sulfotransferase NodH